MDLTEKKRFLFALFFPINFIVLIWIVKLIEIYFNISFVEWGVLPRSISGLKGILLMPFIHSDYSHLINNSIPILILGSSLFYFYRPVAFKVILWSTLMSGLWVWISARGNYHIGASGLVYSLFGFLFFSGFIRKHYRLVAISFLVAFLYGSMVLGIFPISKGVSFEGHLWGMLAGIALAYYYRNIGLKHKPYVWVNEDERDENDPTAYWNKAVENQSEINPEVNTRLAEKQIVFHFKPSKNKEE